MDKAFTLIELVVVIAIIAILSAIILFSISLYINKGKDSNTAGNLAVLVPAGEAYYSANNNSYAGFCTSSVVNYAISKIPDGTTLYCHVATPNYDAWAACAKEFANSSNAYCVDSRNVKEEVANTYCNSIAAGTYSVCNP
jgi:prepilin-type N-terminal cleavage/methylation domain-containing protein